MRRTRVIPVLLIHQGGVYKTKKFKRPIYVGDPINAIRIFNDLEVDEIIVLDIDATKNDKTPDFKIIGELASESFIPFSYGGGIRSVEHAKMVLQCGVEKIVLNHSVQKSTDLITECAASIGSQSVVVSIDYTKNFFRGNICFDYISGTVLENNVIDAAVNAEQAGAGEIFLNSVDRDGLMNGMDIDVIKNIADSINVPFIACGGAGILDHLKDAEQAGASAIAAGSMFVFYGKQKGVLINYPKEAQLCKYLKLVCEKNE